MPVRIKICGIMNVADAELTASLGADWIGLNFCPGSPRRIYASQARTIIDSLNSAVEPVALFIGPSLASAQTMAVRLGVETVQIYDAPRKVLPVGLRWACAFSIENRESLQRVTSYLDIQRGAGTLPHAILVDAHVPGMHGGTGQTAPWHLLADFKPGVPLILAGGLTPENVADAIRIVQPYAVDVASGVESAPGKKDPEKLRRFIDAARSV